MGKQWDADIALTERDAAALIARQFPALGDAHLAPLGTGWDNAAFLVDGRSVFRFPRRQIAAELLAREARVLPALAPHLPCPIPAPAYVSVPTADYPFVFAGYPLIAGQTADRVPLTDRERAALAPALGRFLAALHAVPIDAATRAWAPGDEIARADLRGRAPKVRERLAANAAGLDGPALQALLALVDELATAPPYTGAPCWVHGDLYARHLVLDGARALAGVIDWGDVHLGDPAIDLSIAWSFLPADAQHTFRRAYGAIDEATWARARFRAIHYGAILTEYGADVGDPAMRAIGTDALRFAAPGG